HSVAPLGLFGDLDLVFSTIMSPPLGLFGDLDFVFFYHSVVPPGLSPTNVATLRLPVPNQQPTANSQQPIANSHSSPPTTTSPLARHTVDCRLWTVDPSTSSTTTPTPTS